MEGYQINFNQDFTCICVLNDTAVRLFANGNDNKLDEVFCMDNTEGVRYVQRLFNSAMIIMITEQKPNVLKMFNFKKKQDAFHCNYDSDILSVRMNRVHLVSCLTKSIHVHDIRNMKTLHKLENIAPNELGLIALSHNSHFAFPICATSGELVMYNINKMKCGLKVKAHTTPLSAFCFSPLATLLATSSERGTVIRVFCVKNGQRVQEFRRGVKRCVRISSLIFSNTEEYLCATSNTETAHIFKIDAASIVTAQNKTLAKRDDGKLKLPATARAPTPADQTKKEEDDADSGNSVVGWSDYFSKTIFSYLSMPQVTDVLTQDRAFATVTLPQPGLKYVCALRRTSKGYKLMTASSDGFLYMHEFDEANGGVCKLKNVQDLRGPLEGVVELSLSDAMNKISLPKDEGIFQLFPTAGDSMEALTNCGNTTDNSYASVLKGDKDNKTMTDSAKYRRLCDAIDTPTKLYDENQFPTVAVAAKN